MKVIILCAGLGSRTGLDYPKSLFKFNAINITPINTKTTPEIVNTFICELNKK